MAKEAITTANGLPSNTCSPSGICLMALALALLSSLLTIVFVGVSTTEWFGASEVLETALWLLCPIIGVPLGVSLYKTYSRWNATAGLLDLIVGASYLLSGITMVILRISRRYFPQSFSVLSAVVALLLAPLIFRQSFGLLARKYQLLIVTHRPQSVRRKYFLILAVVFGIVLTLVAIWPSAFALGNIGLASVLACCGALAVSLGSRSVTSRLRSWAAYPACVDTSTRRLGPNEEI